MAEIRIPALKDNLNTVMAFLEEQLELMGCPMKDQMKISLCVEEMFINIASYAYGDTPGEAVLDLEPTADPAGVRITLMDSGMAFNPLDREDPNVTASAEERQIGGLGIFLVKKNMDKVSYRYDDGYNIIEMIRYY